MVYKLKNVTVTYGQKQVLHNITCSIDEGKWISIIGQTGAGKSTFAKLLKGLIPFKGDYHINEQPIKQDSKGNCYVIPEIGFVFQYPEHQLFEITVEKELSFALKSKGIKQTVISDTISSTLPLFDLSEDILPLAPFQLSGGQKRRVAIASVLMTNPNLLIVDEPTAGLDPVSRTKLLKQLKNWQQQTKGTILFVSHQMEDVAQYSDEVMVFHQGSLMGHFQVDTLFLEKTSLLKQVGLALPEAVQLLQLTEELSDEKIQVTSCKEEDIFAKVIPIINARRVDYE
ncbi:ATP-binding cassette domain-containing protein [Rummeliibacillus pycnus]|uniref:ATP-binding cassette domain-containing protein n=1 Tax=Rummeliibacillus pycnus TaxID=101070 RepID=UPI003D2CF3E2